MKSLSVTKWDCYSLCDTHPQSVVNHLLLIIKISFPFAKGGKQTCVKGFLLDIHEKSECSLLFLVSVVLSNVLSSSHDARQTMQTTNVDHEQLNQCPHIKNIGKQKVILDRPSNRVPSCRIQLTEIRKTGRNIKYHPTFHHHFVSIILDNITKKDPITNSWTFLWYTVASELRIKYCKHPVM